MNDGSMINGGFVATMLRVSRITDSCYGQEFSVLDKHEQHTFSPQA